MASGQSLAGALWPPLLRYLTDHHGWRHAFVVYGLIALVVLLPLGLLLRRPPGLELATADGSARRAAARARLAGGPGRAAMLCLAIVGCCVAMAMPMVHIIAHATDLGHPSARAAEMLALLLACAVVSRLLFGARRRPHRRPVDAADRLRPGRR